MPPAHAITAIPETPLECHDRVLHVHAVLVGQQRAGRGLMHVAHATPSVTLFAADEPAHLRLTPRCRSIALQTRSDVSAVDPRELAGTIFDSLDSQPSQSI